MKDERYQIFRIPKRSGGVRIIEAPNPELKKRQQALLRELRREFKASPFAHGFVPYKNIATMAMSHVGKEWVGRLDIRNFFPSITMDMLVDKVTGRKEFVHSPGEKLRIMTLLSNHDLYLIDNGTLRLPQGSPASPFLSNVYLFKFDWRMAWLAEEKKVDYSRYADDLIFSGHDKDKVLSIMQVASQILKKQYELQINPKKFRLMPRWGRQIVCGVVVNDKVNLPRKFRKNLRAELHQKGDNPPRETLGRVAFRDMVLGNNKTSYSSTKIIGSIKMMEILKNGKV